MHHEIIISGFGGQGALFAGQLLAYGALAEGRHVTWIPSYGPEMRGGTANCTVIISDEEIGSPLTRHPTGALVLNPPSFDRFEPAMKTDGVLIVNSSLVATQSKRGDLRVVYVAANDIAAELGAIQLANVVMLGALVQATGMLRFETLDHVLDEHISARHRDKLPLNKQALRRGAALV
ncbi:MAG: 2-oxoacid:ferredoxin oxidoreductase subunit gamma [Chloroflexi bacterium]|nr:2-oxoacid:ferredoxin oxidoreductase subunit gamma [Chloroflexota bacterium]